MGALVLRGEHRHARLGFAKLARVAARSLGKDGEDVACVEHPRGGAVSLDVAAAGLDRRNALAAQENTRLGPTNSDSLARMCIGRPRAGVR